MAGEPQDDCLFCKIVAGHVPATIVRETDTTVAFRDINPQAPTHVLVIPKAHYADAATLAAAAPELAADVLRETQAVVAFVVVDVHAVSGGQSARGMGAVSASSGFTAEPKPLQASEPSASCPR